MGQDRIICMPYLRETFIYSVALDLLGEFKRKFKIGCVKWGPGKTHKDI